MIGTASIEESAGPDRHVAQRLTSRFPRFLARAVATCVLAALIGLTGSASLRAEDFYKGKTIYLMVGSAPGGGYDTYGRLVAQYIRNHIPGDPVIVIQNMPGAGSLVLTNHLAHVAPHDGTVFGAVNPLVSSQPLFYPKRARFDPRQFGWIGSVLRENHIGLARSDTGITSFDDVFKKELIVAGTGGATNSYPLLTNAILKTRFKVVSGYKGTSNGMLAVERGEVGGLVGITWASAQATQSAALKSGKLHVFVQFGLQKHPDLPNVPWVFDYAKSPDDRAALKLILSNQEYGRPFITPPGVPDAVLGILRQAFDETMKDPAFLADAKKRNIDIDPVDGKAIQQLVDETYRSSPQIVDRVRPIFQVSGD
jgi:tripartite-type tricarboxylate transporter receptor subunit TctC